MNASTALQVDDPRDLALIRTLGHGGLLLFVLLAALLWLVKPALQPWVALALVGYAATIISFLGGIHWGIGWAAELRNRINNQTPRSLQLQRRHFLWGVVPPLLGWLGILMPAFAALAWLGFLIILCYLADRSLYPRAGLQQWLTLRFRLSSVAALSCFLGAGAL